jgi:hypothetical protein
MSFASSILGLKGADPLRLSAPEPAHGASGALAELVDPLEQMVQAERADRGLLLLVAGAAAATLLLALVTSFAKGV